MPSRLPLTRSTCRSAAIGPMAGWPSAFRWALAVGLAGLVGAGRTEVARVLFGLTPADRDGVNANASAIRMNGVPVRIESPADAERLRRIAAAEERAGLTLEWLECDAPNN